MAERNPYMMGAPHPRLHDVWVFEGPSLARLPPVVFHYTVDQKAGRVTLWNCFFAVRVRLEFAALLAISLIGLALMLYNLVT